MKFDLDQIKAMDREQLVQTWKGMFRTSLPPRLSKRLLRSLLSFELQAKAHGGLSSSLKRRLAAIGSGKKIARPAARRLEPGARLIREWNGVSHVVDVVDGGVMWKGNRYRSLSSVAREITGAHWSGPRFFGLKP